MRNLVVLCRRCHNLAHELITKRLLIFNETEWSDEYQGIRTVQTISYYLYLDGKISLEGKKLKRAKREAKSMEMRGKHSIYHKEKQKRYI